MSTNNTEQKPDKLNIARQEASWRRDVLNQLSLLFVILGLPVWVLMLANWRPGFIVPGAIFLFLSLSAVLRAEQYTNIRSLILCSALVATGMWSMFQAGLDGTGRLVMGASCVFTAVLLGTRWAALFTALTLLTMTTAGYRAVTLEGQNAFLWINSVVVMLVLLVTAVFALQTLVRRNSELIRRLRSEVELRTQQEQDARQDLEQLRFVTENSTDTVWTMDLDGQITFISKNVLQMRGYTSEEAMQQGPSSLLPLGAGEVTELIAQRLEQDSGSDPDTPFTLRTQLARKGGGSVDVEVTARFLRDADGKPVSIVGATRNISDRMRLDRAMANVIEGTRRTKGADFLVSMTEALASALEVKGVMIGKLTGTGKVETISFWMGGEFKENFEYELKGSPCETVFLSERSICSYREGVEQRFPDDPLVANFGIEAYIGAQLFDDDGEPIGLMACLHDKPIVDLIFAEDLLQIFAGHAAAELVRRKMELESSITRTQLIQAQKLDSIGQLAGGIAHDFNNLLVVIQGYIDLARDKVADQPVLRQYHDNIQGATERAAKLTRQLLSFSRRQVLTKEPVNLNELIEGIQELLSRLLPENISVVFESDSDLMIVDVDKNQVEQAIVNLCVNARDAMPEGGTITFKTANLEVDGEMAKAYPQVDSGRFVQLKVIDTGRGMDESISSRIFEPFFTTKPEGLGTGLGLSVLLGVVEQHGGFVEVQSQPDRGSVFSINLPAKASLSALKPVAVDSEVLTGNELVLVVEDEPMVMDLAKKMLESGGYTVVAAADGRTALELVEQHEDIALAVLDVVLPELSGKELADRISSIRPDLPMMFVSGYAPGGVHTNFVLEEGLTLLQKPYSRDDLLNQVRSVIDA